MVTKSSFPPILTVELLSVGSEIVAGETRDTNAGELARSLTDAGVAVLRLQAVPDRLDVVSAAFTSALVRADLVVSTGGLGPTPDDLTRESIAAVMGEEPAVDPTLEAWLRELWARRDMPFPELNRKQAWLIPSADALPNPNGTAPGWFVERPDGRVIVALPGPPSEMRPMWHDHVLPRLTARGLGADVASRTYRLTGIGESQVAELLGEPLLRATNPEVATYARAEAVDVRIAAVGDVGGSGRSAADLVEEAAGLVVERLGKHIWAIGETTWGDAIGARLDELGWRLAVIEVETGGRFASLVGDVDWMAFDQSVVGDVPASSVDGAEREGASGDGDLVRLARRAIELSGAEVGLAIRTRDRGGDTAVSVAVVTPAGAHRERRMAFLGGRQGRSRAALTAAGILFGVLRETTPSE